MIVRKRNVEGFTIEIDGAEFVFRALTFAEEQDFMNSELSRRIEIALGSLTKVSGLQFEDGSNVGRNQVVNLDNDILNQLIATWAEKRSKLIEEQAAKKAFTSGSSPA